MKLEQAQLESTAAFWAEWRSYEQETPIQRQIRSHFTNGRRLYPFKGDNWDSKQDIDLETFKEKLIAATARNTSHPNAEEAMILFNARYEKLLPEILTRPVKKAPLVPAKIEEPIRKVTRQTGKVNGISAIKPQAIITEELSKGREYLTSIEIPALPTVNSPRAETFYQSVIRLNTSTPGSFNRVPYAYSGLNIDIENHQLQRYFDLRTAVLEANF